ncbi:hypothetical protein EP331_11245 [bacterium]|nr:MAG: hypothetical protein EP331_11245 [bacterium]
MSVFNSIQASALNDSDLRNLVVKYRAWSLSLLGIGAMLLFFLIWKDNDSDLLAIAFFVDFIVMTPIILKSNALHKEVRYRIAKRKHAQKKKSEKPVNITLKFD